ncbi:hypothetical protein DRH14_00670 [Candidatus Shapirobacteria bacterium]|nr:MAG: hypothetical protein DRH14_00670 [Candidatus Shapirobacteria bacterium]
MKLKAILEKVIVLVFISGLVFAVSKAFFRDVEKSTTNVLGAGAINLLVDNQSSFNGQSRSQSSWAFKDLTSSDLFFNFQNLKPGDYGTDKIGLKVNDSSSWLCVELKLNSDDDGSCQVNELKVDTECSENNDDYFDGELGQQLEFVFWVDDGDGIIQGNEHIILNGQAKDVFNGQPISLADFQTNLLSTAGPLPANQEFYLGQAWCYGHINLDPTSPSGYTCDGFPTDNASQTDDLKGKISFYSTQSQNNSNFVCSKNLFLNNPTTYIMENKPEGSPNTSDGIRGVLKYEPIAPTFNYNFVGVGITGEQCLIYYADDWPGNGLTGKTGFLINRGIPDTNGNLSLTGSQDIGTDLPNPDDQNHPNNTPDNMYGAKIWLIPCGQYNETEHKVNSYSSLWLLDYDEAGYRVNYTRSPPPTGQVVGQQSISIDQLGPEINSQYAYQHNYSQANVNFSYVSPSSQLQGQITATGLKPYATYQTKFTGIPTCINQTNGDDSANEYIGYQGRWTCLNCSASAVNNNRTDAQYEANKALADNDPNKECIAGYLVFDYFTADSNGNASKTIVADNSYHVLRCGGGVCDTSSDSYLTQPDSAHPAVNFCPADKVDGEIERFGCHNMSLDQTSYHLKMSLTEESFHQGNWATVLQGDINFTIN